MEDGKGRIWMFGSVSVDIERLGGKGTANRHAHHAGCRKVGRFRLWEEVGGRGG